jgi:hypothetical protein
MMRKIIVNAGMQEKSWSDICIFTNSQLAQYGIDIPASGSVWYCWSQICPALASYTKQ